MVYSDSMRQPVKYEKKLLELMIDNDLTLADAIYTDLIVNEIDPECVFDVVDHLEVNLIDLDKVEYYMSVYSGNSPDVGLRKIH